MSGFETINKIEIYEIDGTEQEGLKRSKLTISEHWNRNEFVVIQFDKEKMTVLADELIRAIKNAQNAHKY